MKNYDAIMVVSFGGPESNEDVMPFLENVLRGKNVPRERMLEVAHHYHEFGGKSPINDQNRALIKALKEELEEAGIDLPVYWGNRNWHPMITDTMKQMQQDGVSRFLALMTSSYSCYSGCRQYREDLMRAQEELGEGSPTFGKIRVWYNHPDWISVNSTMVSAAMKTIPEDKQDNTMVLFCAHSIPVAMAKHSNYEKQLMESARLVAASLNLSKWKLVYQSRSGPPHQPWLEPDVCDVIETLPQEGIEAVVLSPLGFISDHMEVLYDLDTEARETAENVNLAFARAASAGTHPQFIRMLRKLIQERLTDEPLKEAIGDYPPNHDVCPVNCCLSGRPKRS